MRRILWGFVILLLGTGPAAISASAQGVSAGEPDGPPQRWDLNVSAGVFQGRPDEEIRGWDDWYNEGRYAASVGWYWTTHFKTEVEFAVTGEGRQYTQQDVPVPGTTLTYPISVEVFRRLQQASARAVWQFNDNAWVHPYLSVGAVYDIERTRRWTPQDYYYPPGDPRSVARIALLHGINGVGSTDRRLGLTIGGGSKFYFSPAAYVNAGMQVTRARPSTTVTFLAGLGVEF